MLTKANTSNPTMCTTMLISQLGTALKSTKCTEGDWATVSPDRFRETRSADGDLTPAGTDGSKISGDVALGVSVAIPPISLGGSPDT